MKTRSFLCHETADSIDGLTLVDATLADPVAGEVQIEIKACAVNFPDILKRGQISLKKEFLN